MARRRTPAIDPTKLDYTQQRVEGKSGPEFKVTATDPATGRGVGFIHLSRNDRNTRDGFGQSTVELMYVHPDARRSGVADSLYNAGAHLVNPEAKPRSGDAVSPEGLAFAKHRGVDDVSRASMPSWGDDPAAAENVASRSAPIFLEADASGAPYKLARFLAQPPPPPQRRRSMKYNGKQLGFEGSESW